jgi:hypothetical protein
MHSKEITPPPAVVPRKRAHVEDILNPIHEEVIVVKPPPQVATAAAAAAQHQQQPQHQPQQPPPPPPPTTTQESTITDIAKSRSSKLPIQPPPTPPPKQVIRPSSGSGAITISSSTVSSSKSTPTSAPPVIPIKQPKSIRLHVPLNGSTNVYINFASLAEKTYGPEIFNSKRLLGPQGFASSFLNHDRILDTGSDSEAEDDDATSDKNDNTEPGGETDGAVKKTAVKRRRRQNVADKYDVEDPFIDDSEALMEQVAAASKDGFFVYSGPLIAEGERAKIDKYYPIFLTILHYTADECRAEQPKKRKAPAKKPPGEKIPRAKKAKEKDKGKVTESGVEDVPPVIAQ